MTLLPRPLLIVALPLVVLAIVGCGDATNGALPNYVDPAGTDAGTSGTSSSTGSTNAGTGDTASDGATVVPSCASDEGGAPTIAPPGLSGLHVVDNHIENADGKAVPLRGVNRSGTEYMCSQGRGIFDGPSDAASVQAMASWKVNAIRIPLNESCWLGINGVLPCYSGQTYKTAIQKYVALLHQFAIVPILDLHWVGPGDSKADRLQPLPDADHAPAFWSDVATTFKNDDGVVFEPYNEPFPDRNRDTDAAWTCWRDGCASSRALPRQADGGVPPAVTYSAVGMQALVDAIRGAGSTHVLLLGGVQYSNTLTQWLTFEPTDPRNNLGATWHAYNFNGCATADCWAGAPASVAAKVPLVATEIGENHCDDASYVTSYLNPLLGWLDTNAAGYLAWAWVAYGACSAPAANQTQGGQPWSLIRDYASGTPNSLYAQTFHDHLATF